MEIDNYKEEFILKFFKDERFAGWKNIASKLIKTGSCIVAGENPIWVGGIGNFISIKPYKDAYNCSEFTFHKELFFNSDYFQDYLKGGILNISTKIEDLEREKQSLEELLNK